MTKKVKVLHFIECIKREGAQTVIYNWLNIIDKKKVQFDILVFIDGDEEFENEFKKLGCKIYKITPLTIKNYKNFTHELKLFFDKHHYDIVHGHSKTKNVPFLWVAKEKGIKTRISHSHSTKFNQQAILGEILKPLLRRVSTHYFACSYAAGEWLYGKRIINQSNFKVINNGVNTKRFIYDKELRKSVENEFNLENRLVIGHVGRFVTAKNHNFIVEIFKEIVDIKKDAILMLVGDGDKSIVEDIKIRIEKDNISDNVIFTGVRDDVNRLMQRMDLFLMPSLYEGLPVVGVEAQTSGIPCIFSSSITKEVGILEQTTFIDLNESAKVWAQRCIEIYHNSNRGNTVEIVNEKGFNIVEVVNELQKFYLERNW